MLTFVKGSRIVHQDEKNTEGCQRLYDAGYRSRDYDPDLKAKVAAGEVSLEESEAPENPYDNEDHTFGVYKNADDHGWAGWYEDSDGDVVGFLTTDGKVLAAEDVENAPEPDEDWAPEDAE